MTICLHGPVRSTPTHQDHLFLRHVAHGVGDAAGAVPGFLRAGEGYPVGPEGGGIVDHHGRGVETISRAHCDVDVLYENAGLEGRGQGLEKMRDDHLGSLSVDLVAVAKCG